MGSPIIDSLPLLTAELGDTMFNLPGYDAWKTASPPEPEPATCVCGHSEDDHIEPPSGEAFDYYQDLLSLVEAIDTTGLLPHLSERAIASLRKAQKGLALCQHKDCNCRKFEACDA